MTTPGHRNAIPCSRLAALSLRGQIGLLCATTILTAALLAPLAYHFSAEDGLWAVATAGLICLGCSVVALFLAAYLTLRGAALQGLAVGMTLRTMVPLILVVALHRNLPSLAGAGFVYYLLTFYLVLLVAETCLLVSQLPTSRARDAR